MVIGGDRTVVAACQGDGCTETFIVSEVATPPADQIDPGSITCGGRCN